MLKVRTKKINVIGGVVLFFCIIIGTSCTRSVAPKEDEKPLAKVGNMYLYPSDVVGIGAGMAQADSLYQLKIHIEQWVRGQLMLNVAKNNIDVTEQISKMVQEYESTLIMNHYEDALINERLDPEVTPQQLADYYAENKEQYQAGISWVRCHFVKVRREVEGIDDLKKWFKSQDGVDFERVKLFCSQNKTAHILNEDLWVEYDKLVEALPENAITDRHRNNQILLDRMDDTHQYLLRIFEYRDKTDASPLPQVQDEIRRIVLHQRRNKIVQDIRKEVFEKAKKNKEFEIY